MPQLEARSAALSSMDFIQLYRRKPSKFAEHIKSYRGNKAGLARMVSQIESQVRKAVLRNKSDTIDSNDVLLVTDALACINIILQSDMASVIIRKRRSRVALSSIQKLLKGFNRPSSISVVSQQSPDHRPAESASRKQRRKTHSSKTKEKGKGSAKKHCLASDL
ncbi:hypothetical protein CRM22_005673 [Opisthorchis felineus]|uniref:Uncharacterized protein n=1 Tax=Opisthorchis felineus TaxID=147828 RepID=A0A4S2LWZ7_OPIFE|nr:hypothetical protein CRM22_005673 [Opisthorchis felineus]TGZ65838.1 hypothetical protein CRM22_005673 [Opisthorchis felineus]TGZ65840.1 hypothetical protein CRM22_005673 [Opisthorchis felineus]